MSNETFIQAVRDLALQWRKGGGFADHNTDQQMVDGDILLRLLRNHDCAPGETSISIDSARTMDHVLDSSRHNIPVDPAIHLPAGSVVSISLDMTRLTTYVDGQRTDQYRVNDEGRFVPLNPR